MAMAGIDYSNLYEPDYKDKKSIFKEDPGRLKVLAEIVHKLKDVFHRRRELAETTRQKKSGTFIQRHRQIYYDTDQIRETQDESLKVCTDCPGYLLISSRAAGGGHFNVHCISIPLQSCPHCRQEALEHYSKMRQKPTKPFDYLYLQDRIADSYRQYDSRTKEEKIL